MSKIDELLKDEKVEWKKLGEVCEIVRGIRVTKKELIDNGQYPVVSGGIGYMGYVNQYNRGEDTITIAQYGTAGYVCWQKEKFWANDVCFSVYPNYNVVKKYLYHFLLQKQEYLYSISNKSAVPYSISKEKILKIEIPIPSIETQEKIVKTLDKFTNYVTELQSELQSRTKQYEYYRDMLLSEEYLNKISTEIMGSDNKSLNFKIEKLGDCLLNVKKIKWKEINSKIFKYIDLSSVSREFHYICDTDLIKAENAPSRAQQIVCKYDVLFGTTRPLLQRYCLVSEEYDNQICSTGFCVLRANRDKVLPKWLLYQISTSLFLEHLKTHEKGTSYPAISDSDLKLYKILVPSIEVQEHIVSILDKFDFIVNDISKGLPKEIELRQKQYEYYREKLLTFEK